MSTESSSHAGGRTVSVETDGPLGADAMRRLALGCVLILTASYVSVLYDVTHVVGGTRSLLSVVGLMLLAATVCARTIRPRTAAVLALSVAGFGFAYYLTAAGVELGVVFNSTDAIVSDTVALATGLPLLRMVQAGIWTLGFAPAPVFLSWYFALRSHYGPSVVLGGVALGFLVLTGDAGTVVTLIGTLAAIGAVALGELEKRGGSIAQADLLTVLFALAICLSLSVTAVPGEPAGPTHIVQGEAGTLEATIDSAPQRSGISGQVDLSPETRFTVESPTRSYWRTGVYDRFAGDEWIRTGQSSRYNGGQINAPPGEYETVEQTVTVETKLGIIPVAPQPLSIKEDTGQRTTISRHGQPRPETPFQKGDSFTVESAIVDAGASELAAAGTDYPDEVTDHYLQTPEGTSSEFRERTAEITAGATTPYETAVAIERHLESSKEYSLDVSQPAGNVAEGFLLEMDEGYCVYFATTMTQMLREEGVPARYVTGYTSGQQIDDDTYLVRGLDAHAWVEVYFPDHGWVRFDPTPGGSRDEVHTERLREARENGNEDADTEESEDVPLPERPDENPDDTDDSEPPQSPPDERPNESPSDPAAPNESDPQDPAAGSNDSASGPDGPGDTTTTVGTWLERFVTFMRETGAFGLVLIVGLAAGVRRTAAATRFRREVGVYWHGFRADPDRDAERAFRRLERLLSHRYRPRRRSESARAYLRSISESADADGRAPIDPRTERVCECYERAIYGDGVSRADADDAISIVDDLARDRLPVIGRIR
ncbi:transglutaminaseTgpA domain-containing protein [Natrinema caseinilyticum]|uniref:transglutaminaseTgpA domain-containing protein n=1 Tax=Natrinema caseinilyticum TaxID=2961570 RepID=UPI0020C330A7|nr:transglutaminaseTgpA domain-containing protein [Natrinema caseinilyticum]